MVTSCVSSRLVPKCEGEAACAFYGLPHVLCVPVPPYAGAQREVASDPSSSERFGPTDRRTED